MSTEQRDLLLDEREMAGLPYTTTKQSVFNSMDKIPWNGCISRCYFYLSFHIGVATAETREIPISELVAELPYSQRQIYTAIKALKDSGAIIELDNKPNRYLLPHVATTKERRDLAKRTGKSSTGTRPQAAPRPQREPRPPARRQPAATQPSLITKHLSEKTDDFSKHLRGVLERVEAEHQARREEDSLLPADNSDEERSVDDELPF